MVPSMPNTVPRSVCGLRSSRENRVPGFLMAAKFSNISPSMSTDALILRGVTKRFGDFVAVDSLDLSIPRGSIYGFLGPNGAGKTTTIRMVMDILQPDQGSITVLGKPSASEIKDRLGYLPEEKGLYKKMRAGEILTYFGTVEGDGQVRRRANAREAATRTLRPGRLGR